MACDNPAYQQITVKRIELKENTAYQTVHHPAASPQYEYIPHVGVVGEDGVGSKKRESPDYEDVSDLK